MTNVGLFSHGRQIGCSFAALDWCAEVLCANMTSLSAHWQALMSLRWTLLAAVEARI